MKENEKERFSSSEYNDSETPKNSGITSNEKNIENLNKTRNSDSYGSFMNNGSSMENNSINSDISVGTKSTGSQNEKLYNETGLTASQESLGLTGTSGLTANSGPYGDKGMSGTAEAFQNVGGLSRTDIGSTAITTGLLNSSIGSNDFSIPDNLDYNRQGSIDPLGNSKIQK